MSTPLMMNDVIMKKNRKNKRNKDESPVIVVDKIKDTLLAVEELLEFLISKAVRIVLQKKRKKNRKHIKELRRLRRQRLAVYQLEKTAVYAHMFPSVWKSLGFISSNQDLQVAKGLKRQTQRNEWKESTVKIPINLAWATMAVMSLPSNKREEAEAD